MRDYPPRLVGIILLWIALVFWFSALRNVLSLPDEQAGQLCLLAASALSAPVMIWPFVTQSRRLAALVPLALVFTGGFVLMCSL
ncbi:hypothetical protein LOC54_05775 [Acetobacter sp. AN02]|uniref:hypothetical protein n=1 Tax=Acetobacter sp. AN02 TaxID=2894186 RepID=UPI00243462D3|nr:hypothetical protein [Acetobacter sp. AN02]MDG6094621.1 hypothetical protein [Acetobacter sp. AN02]